MLNCWYTLKQSLFTAIQESLGWNGPWENETNHQQSRGGLWLAAKKGIVQTLYPIQQAQNIGH